MTTPERPWEIRRTDPDDQPPEHDPAKPWAVIHPRVAVGKRRKISRFEQYEDALAFVLADPEVRRLTGAR